MYYLGTKKDRHEYEECKATHQCNINHEKSSGFMKAAGVVKIFQHSVQNHKLFYSQYLGDGDTSLFKGVVESNPCSEFGIVPKKVECVCHVQKRLWTRLGNMVKEYSIKAKQLLCQGKENSQKKLLIICKIFKEELSNKTMVVCTKWKKQ